MNSEQIAIVLVLACLFSFLGNKVEGTLWNLSADDHLEMERQLKSLNKPPVVTLVVDPVLYGDAIPHLYARIDAGQTHCFDTRCPGFIVVNNTATLGMKLETSQRGGPINSMKVFIAQDPNSGDWILYFGENRNKLGYWPRALFSTGGPLVMFPPGATSVEFGGEVYSPPGTPRPSMGAGYIPFGTDPHYDAYFGNPSCWYYKGAIPSVIHDEYIMNDDANSFDSVETFQDSDNYQVGWMTISGKYKVNEDTGDYKFLIFYGGSGGSP